MPCRTRFDHLPLHPQRRLVRGHYIPDELAQEPRAMQVYWMLEKHAQRETQRAWPHQTTIAARVGCSVRTVQKAVARLLELGLVAVVKMHGRGNVYTLLRCASEPPQSAPGIHKELVPVKKENPPAPHRGEQRRLFRRRSRRISSASGAIFALTPEQVAEHEAQWWQKVESHLGNAAQSLRASAIAPEACEHAAKRIDELARADVASLEEALKEIESQLAGEVEAALPVEVKAGLTEQVRQEMQKLRELRELPNKDAIFKVEFGLFRKLLFAHYGLPRLSVFYAHAR